MVRNGGVEYAENISRDGGDALGFTAGEVMALIASSAWRTPIVPTTGPRIPPSAQLTTLFAGGGFGNTHR
jgi:hypothetical protein